jgi:hypothetical protein
MSTITKIRILMLIPDLDGGGIQRTVLNLYKSIDTNLFDVSILAHEKLGDFLQKIEQSPPHSWVGCSDMRF